MDDGEREACGALYRLDPNLDWQVIDRGHVVANGPAFSPDYRRLYYSDTFESTVYVFDLSDDGKPSGKRVFATIPAGDGYPDGTPCDAAAGLRVVPPTASRLTRFPPDRNADPVMSSPDTSDTPRPPNVH